MTDCIYTLAMAGRDRLSEEAVMPARHRWHCRMCGELSGDTWTTQRGAANAWLEHAAYHAVDGIGMELLTVQGGANVKPKPARAKPAPRDALKGEGS